MLPVKRKTEIDYICNEMRGKMKEGENEKAHVGADGTDVSRRCYFTSAQISGMSVNCIHGNR